MRQEGDDLRDGEDEIANFLEPISFSASSLFKATISHSKSESESESEARVTVKVIVRVREG